MKNWKPLTRGLQIAMTAGIILGCFTLMAAKKEAIAPGTLTITGIPKEYEGKFIEAPQMTSIPNYSAKLQTSKTIAEGKRTVVKNGETRLPVHVYKFSGKGDGYAGSDILDIRLVMYDQAERGYGDNIAVFQEVKFENGVAELKWDDAVKYGYITVANIPPEYEQGASIQILIGQTTYKLAINAGTIYGRSSVRNGTAIVPVMGSRDASGYISYTKTETKDILLSINPPRDQSEGKAITIDYQFLFKAVPITDGKATLDFRRGTRQQ